VSVDSCFARWLASEGASNDLRAWVEASALDWPELYDTCPRADFMLAIAVRAGADTGSLKRVAVALAGRLADEVHDDAVLAELRELERRAETGIGLADLAARSEAAADRASDHVLSLANHVLALAAGCESNREQVVAIPQILVELALATVMDCAMSSVVGSTHDELARLVRGHLPASAVPVRW